MKFPLHVHLNLAKHCSKSHSSFLSIMLAFVIPPFALKQKVESKVQGKPEPLRASCRPRTTTVIPVYIISVLRSKQLASLFFATFSKSHAFPSSLADCRRCIPLSFS
jgi:hypothetical protein